MVSEAPNDPLANSHVYVIDHAYQIVYMDRAARRMFPGGRVGGVCYECFRGLAEPCKDCPWHPGSKELVMQSVIHSARMDQWFEILCLQLDWFAAGQCVLFSGHPIVDKNSGLFAALSQPSAYDVLFEVSISDDAYRILYHEPDKYAALSSEGYLSTFSQNTLEGLINPQDIGRIQAFWNLATLGARLEKAGGILRGEFRMLLKSGEWGWTAQTLIPVKRGDGGETVFMCFITDIEDQVLARETHEESSHLLMLKERDQLTGLYNAITFYEKADELIKSTPSQHYEVMYVDIEHFKIYNEWHGREAGDMILCGLASNLAQAAHDYKGVAGYLGGDDFALLLPDEPAAENGAYEQVKAAPFNTEETIGFQPAIGVCPVKPPDNSVATACDHAMIAMNSTKGTYTKHLARYCASMAEKFETEAKILLEVKHALENHEFVLYWQPQCSTRTGRIVGLEALVRWNHPVHGLTLPGAFIPILERNGFIASLDLYVWDEVCQHISAWIKKGNQPLPVSVNISRADLYAIDIVDALEGLLQHYHLDRSLLGLEITESSYVEDEKIANVIDRLHELGYTIFMDDFGSGYSSLNMLKDINVDILKIDMGFLGRERASHRSESILEAIVTLSRLMGIRCIAEGAEKEDQIALLKEIGCDYAQGYYFYRPMDTETLERLILDRASVDFRGVLSPEVETIDMNTLLRDTEFNRSIINNLIGGLAVYAVHDNRFELMQVNNGYYQATGCNAVDLKERQPTIWKQVHQDDLATVLTMFDEAEKHPTSGAKSVVRRYRLNGELMWMSLRAFFLGHQDSRRIFYATVEDVTDRYRFELASVGGADSMGRTLALHSTQAAYYWCLNLTKSSFLSEHDRTLLEKSLGFQFEDYSRYDVSEVFCEAIHTNKDSDEVQAFLNFSHILNDFKQGLCSRTLEYRQLAGTAEAPSPFCRPSDDAPRKEGDAAERWMELSYHVIQPPEAGTDDVYAFVYIIDIDERKRRELHLMHAAKYDALTGLLNRQTGLHYLKTLIAATLDDATTGACIIIDLDDFKQINDQYGHLCGDTALSDIAQHVHAAFREQDMFCRWGGDEFVVYCSDISQNDVSLRIASLCETTWCTTMPAGQEIHISVSVGVAMVPQHGTAFTEVYERADSALYQAKRNGKGCFSICSDNKN